MNNTVIGATPGITVEHVLYGLLLLIALGLRFLRLGSAMPLNPVEAGQSWAAWAGVFGYDGMLPVLAQSPLLYTCQRFLFWLTEGGSDGWARALPALVGGFLVLVPWLLRPRLGAFAALLLALFLAFDPWLLTFSRTADGGILSVALGLILIVGITAEDSSEKVNGRWLAVAAGLYLISGPVAWLLLPVIVGAGLLFGPGPLWPADQGERARLITLGGVAALAGATGLLSHWDGLGGISTSLSTALQSLQTSSGYSLGWALLRLAVDELLALTIGVAGLVALWLRPSGLVLSGRGERGWRWLLTGWSVWGFLLLLLPGRNPATLLIIGLPLIISAAILAARLLTYATHRVHWQDGSLILAAVGVLLVTTVFWTNHYNNEWGSEGFDRLTLLFYGIVPLLVLFFIWWAGWRTSSQVFSLLAFGLLALASFSSGWAINQPGETTQGSGLFAHATHQGVQTLADDVARLSSLRALDPHEALVLVDVQPEMQPVLGWQLRSMRQLRFVDGINPAFLTDASALVVTDVMDEIAGLPLPSGYVGSQYPALERWLPTDLVGPSATARWILLRELKNAPPTTSVVLWAREE